MRALLSEAVGGPATLVLREVTEPIPGPGEIRIRVMACGINFPDTLIIEDRYQFKPERPFSPGAEVSGIVDAVGEDVVDFARGDRVLGGYAYGGLADMVVLPAWRCFKIPDAMPFDEASAFLMTYGTSHHALKDRAHAKAGEKLLVLGAAGGVGLAAVELAKKMDLFVIAAVSSQAKADVAARHGADRTIVYSPEPLDRVSGRQFTELVKDVAGGEIDIVYDAVGGTYSEPALRTLGWDGRFLVVGFPAGIANLPLNLPLLKGCHVSGVFWGAFVERFPEHNRQNVQELFDWYCQGHIKPLISGRYPLAQAGEALALLSSRNAVGKLVVTMSDAKVA